MDNQNQITNKINDGFIISLQTPYKGVLKINNFTTTIKGETTDNYYHKEFRWSTDNILYNDWKVLSKSELNRIILNPSNDFWIQYKFTHKNNGNSNVTPLEFVNITLDINTIDGLITKIPMCNINQTNGCCGQSNLIFECCTENNFNPYSVGSASLIYNQMSRVISNMFGFCVRYFKTSANQNSKDVILHEYSLLNVIDENNIKIVIPNNDLPSKEINFNPLMMDYNVVFEVHIVKSQFKQIFGEDSKPEVGDYLYFEQYMNRMYEINATSETNEYLFDGAYWRVSLTPYQKRASVSFDRDEFEIETDTIIFNSDKFNIETEKQEIDARKPEQYNTIGTLENDYVRRILDKKLFIGNEHIYNEWTVISKNFYALKSINPNNKVVVYRYNKGWNVTNERMITFWIRPKSKNKSYIFNIYKDDVDFINVNNKLAISKHNLTNVNVGDVLHITNVKDYNFTQVTNIDDNYIYTSNYFKGYCLKNSNNNITITKFNTEQFFCNESNFNISLFEKGLSLNGNILTFKNNTFLIDKWYGIILMIKPAEKRCASWIYTISNSNSKFDNRNGKIELLEYIVIENANNLTCEDGYWYLNSCNLDITNIRIWNELCEESKHNLILSQYVINDSHKCELVDNAQPELLLDKVTNPR